MNDGVRVAVAGVVERDLDLLLLEEFLASPSFAAWFVGRVVETGWVGTGSCLVVAARRSVTESIGESDLEIDVVLNSGPRHRLLVENKIGAVFQARQAARYHERGLVYQKRGACDGFTTVLVAPEQYLGHGRDRRGFDAVVSYEQISAWFNDAAHQLGQRTVYKIALLTSAIEKAVHGYQLVEDAAVSEFWHAYWAMVTQLAPELEMPEPTGKPAGAGFVHFRPSALPANVKVVHKLRHGYIDLEFAGAGGQLARLREQFGTSLTPEMRIVRAGKSGAIRVTVPCFDTAAPFSEQAHGVMLCIQRAKELLRWYLSIPRAATG